MGKRIINLYLGLRINSASVKEVCIKSENILNEIEKNNLNIKLAWNLACSPLLEESSKEADNLIIEIKTRIKTKNDVIIPIGYTGALHPFLTEREINKELNWCKQNEKGSGIKDIFNLEPDIIFPVIPELNRKNFIQVYKDTGFKYIGISQKQNHINPFNIKNELSVNLISFIEFYKTTDITFIRALKKVIKHQNNNLILMICYKPSFYENHELNDVSIIELITMLEKYFNINFCSFNEINKIDSDTYKQLSFYDLPSYPEIRKRGLNAIKYRKIDDNYYQILNVFNPFKPVKIHSDISPLKSSFHNSRQNVSVMHGEVVLYGNNFNVNFLNGRLFGINRNNKNISVNRQSESYIVASGKKHKYKLLNAFSIEGERTRGLRSNMVINIDKKVFNFQSDYIFVDDFPYLIVTSYIDYPEIKNHSVLEQIAPIEIPLFYFEDTVQVTGIYPDNSASSFKVDSTSDFIVATGNIFYFQNEETGILFGYPGDRAPLISTCQIKIQKKHNKYLLSINPFGSYIFNDLRHYNKRKEIFSFYLGVSEYCPKSIPVLPDYVLNEIPFGSVSN